MYHQVLEGGATRVMNPTVEFEEGFAVVIREIVSRPSLNECCGEVMRVLDDRCAVFMKKTGETISIKRSNLEYES